MDPMTLSTRLLLKSAAVEIETNWDGLLETMFHNGTEAWVRQLVEEQLTDFGASRVGGWDVTRVDR